MRDCIFTAHCMEQICDKSCPAFVETNYLLERNNLINSTSVYSASPDSVQAMVNVLNRCKDSFGVHIVTNGSTIDSADLLTYCAICKYWKGSQLHLSVYHLRYLQYLESTKQSWSSNRDDDNLEYTNIWIRSAKVLIISSIDYVNFGEFEAQTLLSLIQARQSQSLTTIIVSPPLRSLVSTKSSFFFTTLKRMMETHCKEVKDR